MDVYEDKHQLFVGNWLLKGNSIWFTTVDDINQYVYPTDRKNVLNKDYLYCYDLTSKTVKKVCKYRSIGERNKILDELSHNMREYNGMQIFIPASSSIYLGDSFIVVIDINTPEPKPEYINIPVNGTNAELFYSNESLFIAEKRSGLPIYKFDIDTMTRTQLGSDCGKTSVSKSSLFKSSEIEYIIWNDVQVVGNWLYYKSGEPLGEGCNIICVDMDKPMQMSKIVLQ